MQTFKVSPNAVAAATGETEVQERAVRSLPAAGVARVRTGEIDREDRLRAGIGEMSVAGRRREADRLNAAAMIEIATGLRAQSHLSRRRCTWNSFRSRMRSRRSLARFARATARIRSLARRAFSWIVQSAIA